MKTKDLVYIGIIAYLAYLLVKKKSKTQETETSTTTAPDVTSNNTLGTTVGNATNGGLNLGTNMDLPNLTPTSSNGLSTEVALNSSNVSSIIRDENLPTQIFGNVSLPAPYTSTSIVNPYPVDVVPTVTQPTSSTPASSTTVSETIIDEPIKNVGIRPIKNISNIYSEEIIEQPIAPTISAPIKGSSIIAEPIVTPIKNTSSDIYSGEIIEQPTASTISTPVKSGSLVAEPFFPIKTIKAELITNEPKMGSSIPLTQDVSDEMILECGNSFSIPNNDKEGSYTNYWFDGKEYYTQTTSPLIKTIPTKISKTAYVEGCKRLQAFKLQNSKF
jgi:hypothetical protein